MLQKNNVAQEISTYVRISSETETEKGSVSFLFPNPIYCDFYLCQDCNKILMLNNTYFHSPYWNAYQAVSSGVLSSFSSFTLFKKHWIRS